MDSQLETLDVAAAIIEYHYKYLIVKRAPHKENPGLWEFPGGKLQPGESLKACVERELKEEFEISSIARELMASTETKVGDKIIRLFGLKTTITNEPKIFKDHTEMKWVSLDELSGFPMTAPDLALLHHFQGHSVREREISHVTLSSVAKIYGIFYGLLGTVMGIYFIFSPSLDTTSRGLISSSYKIVVALLLPFVNFLIGAVFGTIIGFFYNLVSELLGGIKVRIR